MAGFLGIGGKNSKQQNQSIGNLNNLFNFGFGQSSGLAAGGTSGVNAGQETLGSAGGYFSKLMSGNRSAIQQAQAPATNATLSAADAAKRQQATMGTARGGGVAGANQQRDSQTQAQIDNALFAVGPEAAKEEASVGAAQGQLGAEELSAGIGFGNMAGTSTSNAGSIATSAREQAAKEQAAAITAGIGLIFG